MDEGRASFRPRLVKILFPGWRTYFASPTLYKTLVRFCRSGDRKPGNLLGNVANKLETIQDFDSGSCTPLDSE
jgi:hypothetical protein